MSGLLRTVETTRHDGLVRSGSFRASGMCPSAQTADGGKAELWHGAGAGGGADSGPRSVAVDTQPRGPGIVPPEPDGRLRRDAQARTCADFCPGGRWVRPSRSAVAGSEDLGVSQMIRCYQKCVDFKPLLAHSFAAAIENERRALGVWWTVFSQGNVSHPQRLGFPVGPGGWSFRSAEWRRPHRLRGSKDGNRSSREEEVERFNVRGRSL